MKKVCYTETRASITGIPCAEYKSAIIFTYSAAVNRAAYDTQTYMNSHIDCRMSGEEVFSATDSHVCLETITKACSCANL